MTVMMIRARVREDTVNQVEQAAQTMFAAIAERQPTGVRYSSSRLPDGQTYVALLELDDPRHNPLAEIPEFAAFQESLKGWLAGPPAAEALEPIGSYRMFEATNP
ncbi:MAG TPA: hypothetical protein VF482_03725 [Trebonia sp.]